MPGVPAAAPILLFAAPQPWPEVRVGADMDGGGCVDPTSSSVVGELPRSPPARPGQRRRGPITAPSGASLARHTSHASGQGLIRSSKRSFKRGCLGGAAKRGAALGCGGFGRIGASDTGVNAVPRRGPFVVNAGRWRLSLPAAAAANCVAAAAGRAPNVCGG